MFTHMPLQHTSAPVWHTLPQVPQLSGSVWVSVHELTQQVRPVGQAGLHSEQFPDAHVWPAPQSNPQSPQLLGSVWRLVHVPSQHVVPLVQDSLHCEQDPSTQYSSGPHTLPQVPQLGVTVLLTQVPSQQIVPAAQLMPLHPHTPATHVCSSAQV
jgi:hypothetical protein